MNPAGPANASQVTRTAESERQRRRRLWTFVALGIVAIAIVLWVVLHKPTQKKPPPHPIPVTAVKAQAEDFQLAITALGAAQAWTSDTIFAQVSGKLIRVNFAEGSDVKAGQVLAEVDPRPYQAVLTQAEGTLKRDEAALAGAKRDLERYQHLQAEGGASRQQLEDEMATVGQDEGTVQLDRGQVAAARLNVEFCRIVSPVSGRAGVRLVDPGNLVSASGSVSSVAATASAASSASTTSANGSGIVVINQIEPIAVTFTVPQGQFQRLVTASDGFRRPLPVRALSQETGEQLDTGTLSIADNRVDQATGTVELKARFENPGRKLWPGQFVNVSLGVQQLSQAIVLPLSAVNRGPKGQYAFVVAAGNKVSMRPIAVLAVQGQSAVIKSGINPGDLVVTDGQMVLQDGSLVRVAHTTTGAAP